jgi:hypothetical protein
MTETEWAECADPGRMLNAVRGKLSARKLYLYAVACCWGAWRNTGDPAWKQVLEAAERFADHQIVWVDLWRFHHAAASRRKSPKPFLFPDLAERLIHIESLPEHSANQFGSLLGALEAQVAGIARLALRAAYEDAATPLPPGLVQSQACQSLRDIVGNPGQGIIAGTPNLTGPYAVAARLAEAIYEEKAFERLPILGDALEEAGCVNQAMLAHCRQEGEHVKGCWVLDLLLAKT